MKLDFSIEHKGVPSLRVWGLPTGVRPSSANPVRITFPSGKSLFLADGELAWRTKQQHAADRGGFDMLVVRCQEAVEAGNGRFSTTEFELQGVGPSGDLGTLVAHESAWDDLGALVAHEIASFHPLTAEEVRLALRDLDQRSDANPLSRSGAAQSLGDEARARIRKLLAETGRRLEWEPSEQDRIEKLYTTVKPPYSRKNPVDALTVLLNQATTYHADAETTATVLRCERQLLRHNRFAVPHGAHSDSNMAERFKALFALIGFLTQVCRRGRRGCGEDNCASKRCVSRSEDVGVDEAAEALSVWTERGFLSKPYRASEILEFIGMHRS